MIVIDDFAPIGLINAARASWPGPTWEHWHRYTGTHGNKYASKDASRLTEPCRLLIARMAELTPDRDSWPDLVLYGAGMHWIPEGGRLPLHFDAQTHPLHGWSRRWNAVLYLDCPSGGELVFRNAAGQIIQQVAPLINRLALFETTAEHEVLPVLAGDRRSLSLFWWAPSTGTTGPLSAAWSADAGPVV